MESIENLLFKFFKLYKDHNICVIWSRRSQSHSPFLTISSMKNAAYTNLGSNILLTVTLVSYSCPLYGIVLLFHFVKMYSLFYGDINT